MLPSNVLLHSLPIENPPNNVKKTEKIQFYGEAMRYACSVNTVENAVL
jgi:hypothetical protein